MLGGIEAGGTKFVCGAGTGPDDLCGESVPTTTPQETIARVVSFFQKRCGPDLRAVGIGSFGPVDLNPASPHYGHITSTPKPGWPDCDLRGMIQRALNVPVGFDTDVNAALLGEARWGAARGLSDAVYLTIGTGVGGGAIVQGRVVHGLVHPEMGHLRIPHDLSRDPYPGHCPYHGDCLEGLACGPAMKARWRVQANDLPDSHPAWDLEAHYIALGLVNVAVTLSPQRILLGGGVMQKAHLFPLIRQEFVKLLNGYVVHPKITEQTESFIAPPELAPWSGILGCFVLAEHALERDLA
jgi:fructokinase